MQLLVHMKKLVKKKFTLINKDDQFSVKFNRSLEINYGLRNFIGNANKFSSYNIEITIKSSEKFSEVLIKDDGPGFPEDIIDKIGQPYIRASSNKDKSKTGLGLGTFIGKTLLEKNNAKVEFKNFKENKGALVKIIWLNENLKKI